MQPRPHRVLVVSDSADCRRRVGELVRDLLVDTYWLNDASDLIEYTRWCQPRMIVIGMCEPQRSYGLYAQLQAWLGHSPVRLVLLEAATDGAPFPSPHRLSFDSYLPSTPTLHELAWQVQRCVSVPPGTFARLGRPTPGSARSR